MIPDHPFDDYRGRRVLVMGLGSFGGGIGAVRFLVSRGASVTVTDRRSSETLAEALNELKDTPPDRLVLGQHREDDFTSADLVVVNPAVKRDCPYLNAALGAGVPLTSEMNLFWKWNRAPVIGVTGSNGKSTTTALIYAILEKFLSSQSGRRVWLGGNIGKSLLPQVDQIRPTDLVVLELSSFQLTDLDRLQVSPHVAVITNFAPNHLDWHPGLDHYRSAKQTMLRWQGESDVAVVNGDDLDVKQWGTRGIRREFSLQQGDSPAIYYEHPMAVVRSGNSVMRWPLREWLTLPGDHNVANALAAITAAITMGANETSVREGISSYKPLPHRLQLIAEVEGRKFYNDSLATTPESTEVALRAFDEPIVLLAGGYDKQVDLSGMSAAIAARAKAVSLMGQTAAPLNSLLNAVPSTMCIVSEPQSSLEAAFEWAVGQSAPGDIVLLSPGCASYDWFRNFADRGDQFTGLVRQFAVRAGAMMS
ncbi:UDP-N-acetylmuramoyl-L-alanine--D-glutamate ligase [Schlesneria sp. DSM 10557]|uniref:UDP-N-acetylmuramoyl-L-alanine--D-glutamate ligase n=2 Tax=unclassified Schlesneria TaxID=2762017 RepID=UPI0035A1256E